MTKRISIASAVLTTWAIALTMLLAVTPVAFAHHAGDHDKGKGHNASQGEGQGKGGNTQPETTEDNDDDGVPNSPDPEGDSDNKHPSGKDKHEEAGGSGNQGKAKSDPDDDGRGPDRSNGGVDQPGGTGGEDQLDQDGNNGCGNDDDFEDDNEGLCLGRQGPKPKDDDEVGGDVVIDRPGNKDDNDEEEEIEGGLIENPGFPDDGRPGTDIVLGGRLTNEAAPEVEAGVLTAPSAEEGAVLPFTGAGISSIVLAGLFLMTTGGILARRRK